MNEASYIRFSRVSDDAELHGGVPVIDQPDSMKVSFRSPKEAAAWAVRIIDKYRMRVDIRNNNVFVWESRMSKAERLIESLIESDPLDQVRAFCKKVNATILQDDAREFIARFQSRRNSKGKIINDPVDRDECCRLAYDLHLVVLKLGPLGMKILKEH